MEIAPTGNAETPNSSASSPSPSPSLKAEARSLDNTNTQATPAAEPGNSNTDGAAQLVFKKSELPPTTDSVSYPEGATATTLEHSKYKYVSLLNYQQKPGVLHFKIGTELRYLCRGSRVLQRGRVGSIAVHVRPPPKPGQQSRVDVSIVMVTDGKARGSKVSAFAPAAEQPQDSPLSPAQENEIVGLARGWVFENHVQKAAKRAKKKAEIEAMRAASKHGTRASTGPGHAPSSSHPGHHDCLSLPDLQLAMTAAMTPLAHSIEHLSRQHSTPGAQQLSLAVGQQHQQQPHQQPSQQPHAWPSAACPSAPPSAGVPLQFTAAQAPYLAAALQHSQLSAYHLAEESRLLSAALAQPIEVETAPPTLTALPLRAASTAETEAPESSPSPGRKKRRKHA